MLFPAPHGFCSAARMDGVRKRSYFIEEVKSMACGKKCGTKATAKKKTAKKK
jgi:hypothetical protein